MSGPCVYWASLKLINTARRCKGSVSSLLMPRLTASYGWMPVPSISKDYHMAYHLPKRWLKPKLQFLPSIACIPWLSETNVAAKPSLNWLSVFVNFCGVNSSPRRQRWKHDWVETHSASHHLVSLHTLALAHCQLSASNSGGLSGDFYPRGCGFCFFSLDCSSSLFSTVLISLSQSPFSCCASKSRQLVSFWLLG